MHPVTSFDFLGYTFRLHRSKNSYGMLFTSFNPAMKAVTSKAVGEVIGRWKLHLRSDKPLFDLIFMFMVKTQGLTMGAR